MLILGTIAFISAVTFLQKKFFGKTNEGSTVSLPPAATNEVVDSTPLSFGEALSSHADAPGLRLELRAPFTQTRQEDGARCVETTAWQVNTIDMDGNTIETVQSHQKSLAGILLDDSIASQTDVEELDKIVVHITEGYMSEYELTDKSGAFKASTYM